MIGLREISERLSGRPAVAVKPQPVAAAVVGLLSFNRSWARTMDNIDSQITGAQQRREALVSERDSVVLAAVEGDEQSRKRADALDRQIEDVDRELSRLSIARHRAAERQELDRSAEAEKARRERIKAARAAVGVWQEKAKSVDDALAALIKEIAVFTAAGEDVRRIVDDPDRFGWVFAKMLGAVPNIVEDRLATTGYRFSQMAFAPENERRIRFHVPSADYAVSILQKQAERRRDAA